MFIRFRITHLLVVPLAALALPLSALGQISFETVALEGAAAPEAQGAVFESFSDVKINVQGDVVFGAKLTHGTGGVNGSNDFGIWRKRTAAAIEKIARTGDTTPPFTTWGVTLNEDPLATAVIYETLNGIALGNDGNVAYVSKFVVNDDTVYGWQDEGAWVTGDGTISYPGEGTSTQNWLMSREGYRAYYAYDGNGDQTTDVNGVTWSHVEYRQPAIGDEGTVTFGGSFGNWREVTPGEWEYFEFDGIWKYPRPAPGGAFDPVYDMSFPFFVAVEDIEAPGVPGSKFATFARAQTSITGETPFFAVMKEGEGGVTSTTADGFWIQDAANVSSKIVTAGEVAPGSSAAYWSFGVPAVAGENKTAFWASLLTPATGGASASTEEGIWLREGSVVARIAAQGSQASGCEMGTVFDYFDDPGVNANGVCAFLAHVTSPVILESNNRGIWSGGSSDTLDLIARAGDAVPGVSGTVFKSFSSPRINVLGQIAFTASFVNTGADERESGFGCWAMNTNGQLLAVIKEGDSIPVAPGDNRVVSSFVISDFSEAGELALTVQFDDGTSGVLKGAVAAASPVLTFAQWAAATIPNAALRGESDDPDGDGRINFMEFALGLDPLSGDASGAPVASMVTVDGATALQLAFERPLGDAGVTYDVQVSDDLENWITVHDMQNVKLAGNGMQQIVVRDVETLAASESSRRFIRVVAVSSN